MEHNVNFSVRGAMVTVAIVTGDVTSVAVPLKGTVLAESLSVIAGVWIMTDRSSTRHLIGPSLGSRRYDGVVCQWRHLVNATVVVD